MCARNFAADQRPAAILLLALRGRSLFVVFGFFLAFVLRNRKKRNLGVARESRTIHDSSTNLLNRNRTRSPTRSTFVPAEGSVGASNALDAPSRPIRFRFALDPGPSVLRRVLFLRRTQRKTMQSRRSFVCPGRAPWVRLLRRGRRRRRPVPNGPRMLAMPAMPGILDGRRRSGRLCRHVRSFRCGVGAALFGRFWVASVSPHSPKDSRDDAGDSREATGSRAAAALSLSLSLSLCV